MKLQLGNENTRGNPWPHDNYLPSKPRTNGEFSCDCPGLCGPRKNSKIRGYHPVPNAFSQTDIIKKCYPGKESFVEFIFKDAAVDPDLLSSPRVLNQIEILSDDSILECVERVGIERYVAEVLIQRKQSIREDYTEWLQQVGDIYSSRLNSP